MQWHQCFWLWKKYVYPIYISKNTLKRCVDLLSIGEEEGNRHYALILDFNIIQVWSYITQQRKTFLLFSTAEILKSHVNDYFKINGKQMIKMPKISEYFRFKHYKRKIKSAFMIYADFERILVPKDNKKQIKLSLT